MSTASEIRNKIVDYKIYTSSNEIIPKEEELGYLNVVVSEDNNSNALYVGDTHIASGYGFKSIIDRQSLEELLSNPNIQKILNGEIYQQPEEDDEPSTVDIEIGDSSITIHDSTISLTNGVLNGETFIRIYDPYIKLSDDTVLHEYEEYEYSILKPELSIKRIDFNYDICSRNKIIKYKVDTSLVGVDESLDLLNGTSISDLTTDGRNHHKSIENLDIKLLKNNVDTEISIPINLILTDESLYTFNKIANIKYKYPVFISSNSNDYSDINFNDSEDVRWKLYDSKHGSEVKIENVEPTYVYIYIPEIIVNKNNPSFIYKPSNVACEFNRKGTTTIGSNIYYIFESPFKYTGELTWIIK